MTLLEQLKEKKRFDEGFMFEYTKSQHAAVIAALEEREVRSPKIFEIQSSGEKDWVVADDMFEAIKWYLSETDNSFLDLDSVFELSTENANEYVVKFDDNEEYTFAKAIEVDERMPPYILASTAY